MRGLFAILGWLMVSGGSALYDARLGLLVGGGLFLAASLIPYLRR